MPPLVWVLCTSIAASDLSAAVYVYSHETDLHLANVDLKLEGKYMLSWLSRFKAMNSAIKIFGSTFFVKYIHAFRGVNESTIQNNIRPVLKSVGLVAEIWFYFHNTGNKLLVNGGSQPYC